MLHAPPRWAATLDARRASTVPTRNSYHIMIMLTAADRDDSNAMLAKVHTYPVMPPQVPRGRRTTPWRNDLRQPMAVITTVTLLLVPVYEPS